MWLLQKGRVAATLKKSEGVFLDNLLSSLAELRDGNRNI
jgi:hypothetical protein